MDKNCDKIKDICKNCKKCNNNPNEHWNEFPQDCPLSGYIFLRQEKDMEDVRRAKEELLTCSVLKQKTITPGELNKIVRKEQLLNKFIAEFHNYGSKNW